MEKICKVCGETRHMMSWEDTCYTCMKRQYLDDLKEEIMNGDTYSTSCEDKVICPWCGEVQEYDFDDHEIYEEGEHDMICHLCDKSFRMQTNVSYYYDTERLED